MDKEKKGSKTELSTIVIGEKKDKRFRVIPNDANWQQYRLVRDGIDYTPHPLKVKKYPVVPNRTISYLWKCLDYKEEKVRESEMSISSVSILEKRESSRYRLSSRLKKSKSSLASSEYDLENIVLKRRLDFGLDNFDTPLKSVPSLFRLREDPLPRKDEGILNFTVRFEETDLINLFEYNTCYIDAEIPEANYFIYMNKVLATQKETEKISTRYSEEWTQTDLVNTIDNFTKMPKNSRKNLEMQAYNSEILETYFHFGLLTPPEIDVKILTSLVQIEDLDKHTVVTTDEELDEDIDKITEREKLLPPILDILESPEFTRAVTAVERVLVSNMFIDRQLLFMDKMYQNPEEEKINFKYQPSYLLAYSCPRTKGKPVTSISWSCLEPFLFAVSYGKYFNNDEDIEGLICVWNLKNTEFPERIIHFSSSVTYVDFSKKYPRVLAAGFFEGHCALIDVVPRNVELMCSTEYTPNRDCLPIWQIKWFLNDDGDENPISVGHSGKILLYRKNHSMTPIKLLTVNRREGTIKGIPRKEIENPIFNFVPAATCFCAHPTNRNLYLIGTSDGCVHICSIHLKQQHLDVFSAHRGHVTNIQFHPATEKLFLTSGTDFHIRIWAYNIFKPVLSLTTRLEFIEQAIWNPTYPLIIASISGQHLDIWDIRKEYLQPIKTIKNKHKQRNTCLVFTKDGSNILVGDMDGRILVYTLYGMPFVPNDPLIILAQIIKKHLLGDKDHLEKVMSTLGEPFLSVIKEEKDEP